MPALFGAANHICVGKPGLLDFPTIGAPAQSARWVHRAPLPAKNESIMTHCIPAALTAAALSVAVLGSAAFAELARYELDPTHTTVSFLVDHVGYAGTLGLFGEVEGGFTYDMDTQTLSDLEVRVMSDSLVTLNDARDNHVRGGDFLDVANHPVITFTADGGTASDDTSGQVTGDLTVLGTTLPLTLEVTLNKAAAYPFAHQRFVLGISARGELDRSSFGMTYGVDNGLVGDRVQIIIETEAMQMD